MYGIVGQMNVEALVLGNIILHVQVITAQELILLEYALVHELETVAGRLTV